MRTHGLVLGLFAGLTSSVLHAQSVGPAVLIAQGSSTRSWMETAIIASPANSNHAVVVFQDEATGGGISHDVYYAVTTSGFAAITGPTAYPSPSPSCGGSQSFDPMVAASAQTGDLYIGCILGGKPSIMRKPFGQSFSGSIHAYPCEYPDVGGWDKCFMAMGPWPQGTSHTLPETLYIGTFAGVIPPSHNRRIFSGHSEDASPPGMSWSSSGDDLRPVNAHGVNPGSDTAGAAPYPVVVPSGATAGRVIVSFYDDRHPDWVPTSNFAVAVTYSDMGGDPLVSGLRRWNQAYRFTSFGSAPVTPIYLSQGTLNNSVTAHGFPSVSIDPDSPGTVYIAFIGSVSSDGRTRDVYIARGTTDLVNPAHPLSFSPTDTVRVTDTMLRPGGVSEGTTNEFMPSICIDNEGGINLLYCREQADVDGPNTIAVRYARWANWTSLAASQAAYVSSFTPNFPGFASGGNDYQMICLAGCKLYAAYASNENGKWDVYVRVIDITDSCAGADIDGDGAVSTSDVSTFNVAFSAGDPLADRNRDGEVQTADAVQFLAAYSQAITPP
jgi:hypothetical protein